MKFFAGFFLIMAKYVTFCYRGGLKPQIIISHSVSIPYIILWVDWDIPIFPRSVIRRVASELPILQDDDDNNIGYAANHTPAPRGLRSVQPPLAIHKPLRTNEI
jgi:hypothetical protein